MLEQIREILLLHNGKKNPITSAEIAKSLGIVEDDTHAQTRALILECAEEYELPLAANNRGYYLISDQQEYEESIWQILIHAARVSNSESELSQRIIRGQNDEIHFEE